MNYEEFYNKINNGDYNSKLPYPHYPINNAYEKSLAHDAKRAYGENTRRLQILFESDMRKYLESEIGKPLTDAQFNAVFSKAWEDGHSSGYSEVLTCANNLIDLIKVFIK